jgi:aspartate kinase
MQIVRESSKMALVVQKFGGSSLADLDKLGAVAGWVAARHAAGDSLAVVVSAMGKATEGLLGLAREAASVRAGFEPPRRELDMLVSTGERVSMALLSIALHARGVPAVSFTGSQSGIITTDRHFDARILEVRADRVRNALELGQVVIVAGYQGMSQAREITTLGRGGSDTTAVALAAALAAERCEIYSDVDGVYSADPNRVSKARHLPAIDYDTMAEMAIAGAKVLNLHAVTCARRHGLTLHARRTADFVGGGTGRETRVEQGARAAHAVVVNPALWLIFGAPTARASVEEAAHALELPFRALQPESGRPLGSVALAGVPDPAGARRALELSLPDVQVVSGYGELSAVGSSIGDAGRQRAALLRLPATPLFTATCARRFSAFVPLATLDQAERLWHELWVEEPELSSPAQSRARESSETNRETSR